MRCPAIWSLCHERRCVGGFRQNLCPEIRIYVNYRQRISVARSTNIKIRRYLRRYLLIKRVATLLHSKSICVVPLMTENFEDCADNFILIPRESNQGLSKFQWLIQQYIKIEYLI